MKLIDVSYKDPTKGKITAIRISNHGVEYTITSDFFGLLIETDNKRIGCIAAGSTNKIVVK